LAFDADFFCGFEALDTRIFFGFFLKNLFDNSKNYIFAENYGLKRPFQNLKQLGNFKYNHKK